MNIDSKAFRKFSYGLFVLTTRAGERDNGCISNTAIQISSSPYSLGVAVNKGNLTHDMILEAGQFNLSILTQEAPFALFDQFGLHSGRDTDKFAGMDVPRMENGISYFPNCSNAAISAKVTDTVDCGTHTLFVAQVTQALVLSGDPSMTYDYYFSSVKPKKPAPPAAEAAAPKKKGYVCSICGYIYEGDELPADFVCPLCSHGAEFFEPLQ